MKQLATKLAEVMAAVSRVPKRGRNEFHKYDYATEADIAEAIRKELAERHLVLLPAITGCQREPVGEKGSVLTTLTMEFTFIDGESGETLTRPWLGAGTDKEDKGVYKAMTGGEKYFLLKTFLLPTGDDPEQSTERPEKSAKPPAKKPRPSPPDGAVYLDKLVARSSGQRKWTDVVLSTGEAAFISKPQVIAAAMKHAQESVPVVIRAHVNDKGNMEIDHLEQWQPPAPEAAVKELTADEIGF